MITSTDAANIIFRDCKPFDLPRYQGGNVPDGKVENGGRIVIHSKQQTPGGRWMKNYVEVNIVIPDTPNGKANLVQLNAYEREARIRLNGSDTYDGTIYRYWVDSTSILQNEQLKSHYVNARVLFQAMNTLED